MRIIVFLIMFYSGVVMAQVTPAIPSGTVLGNSTGSTAAPSAQSNPTISGVNLATQTLQLGASSGSPLPFGATNSLWYTNGAAGGITLQGYATNPGNDVMIAPFDIYIASDTANTAYTAGSNTSMNWFSVEGHAKAGHVGGRTPINARLFIDGAPTATTNAAYSAGTFVTSVTVNLTGATGIYQNYAGSVYGANPNVFTQAGATFINQINAQESDVALALGSSAAEKHAMTLVQTGTDSVRAVYDDAALEYTAQDRWNATCTTSPLAINTTTCTMASGSGMTAGDFVVVFHDTAQDVRYIACTGADPSLVCTWSPGLTSATTLVGGDDIGNVAPWAYGINFGSYAHLAPFWQTLTATDTNVFTGSTLIGFSNRTVGGAMTANANIGIDWHNVTFSSYSLDLPGHTVDPSGNMFTHSLKLDTAYSFAAELGATGIAYNAPSATFTDTAANNSPTYEVAYSDGVPTFTSANTIGATNVITHYFAAPLVGGTLTGTNLWSIFAAGAVHAASYTSTTGATLGGGVVALGTNGSNNVNINVGTSTGATHIADGTGASAITIGNTTGPTTTTMVGVTTINASANATTSINTGTSTGAVHIGDGSGNNAVTIGNGTGIDMIQGPFTASNATVKLSALATSSSAQTGTVCSGTGGLLTVDTTTTCLLSDGRHKMNIDPLTGALAEIMQLKPVSYDLKPDVNPTGLGRQVGLIAQDVIKVDPRLASVYQSGPDKGTPSGVRYEQMVALLVRGMQEQQHEIDQLKRQLKKRLH